MSYKYILKDVIRSYEKLNWYISRGWEVVGVRIYGGSESFVLRRIDG